MSNIPANPQNLAVVMARPLAAMYQAMPRLHRELPETPVSGMNDAELTVGDLRAADVIVNRDRMVYVAMRQANAHLLNFLAHRIFTPRPMQKFRCICPNRSYDLNSLCGLNELVYSKFVTFVKTLQVRYKEMISNTTGLLFAPLEGTLWSLTNERH